MKPFIFKLQTALHLKEKREDAKKEELYKATSAYNEGLNHLKGLQNKYSEGQQGMRDKQKDEVDYRYISFYIDFLMSLEEKIKQQNRIAETLRQAMEKTRVELVEAIRERKVLDKLKAKHYSAYLKEYLREEQKLIDEMATISYTRRDPAI